MDPELEKRLTALREKGATDDQIREYASQWSTRVAAPDTTTAAPAAASPPEKPGVFSRAGSMLMNAATHPGQTLKSAITAPLDAMSTAVSLGTGDPYAAFEAFATQPKETAGALAQSAALALGGKAGGKVEEAAAPYVWKGLAKLGGLATTGAVEGAAFNPSDPLAGAVAGGVAAPVVDAAARGTVGTANALARSRRIATAPTLGQTELARSSALEATDKANYGQADAEAQAQGGTSPALQSALDHPRIAPYANRVRNSALGEGASDADIASETYKLMSRQRKGLQAKMDRDGYDADADLEIQNLKQAQRVLKNATTAQSQKPPITMDVPADVTSVAPKVVPGRETMAGPVTGQPLAETTTAPPNPSLRHALRDFPESSLPPTMQGPGGPAFQLRGQPDQMTPGVDISTPAMRIQTAPAQDVPAVMPSFPKAVAEHADQAGQLKAFHTGADMAQRVMAAKSVAAKRLGTQSAEAWLQQIQQLPPDEAQAQLEGVLGRAKERSSHRNLHPTLFGAVTSVAKPLIRSHRIAPFVDALDDQINGPPTIPRGSMSDLLQRLGLVGVTANGTTGTEQQTP